MTYEEIIQALRCCAKGLGHDDACENCKVGEIQDRREYIEFAAANVIDPCCGSGSTLRAAAEAGRSAIGFEIDKSFYLAAKEKMLAGVREAQKTARDAGSQITIGEITEAAQQGGRPV